jgi:FecR-like protein/type II secretion system (T2SS) protein G
LSNFQITKKYLFFTIMLIFIMSVFHTSVFAGEIELANGKILKGRIVTESKTSITMETEELGSVTFVKKDINKIQRTPGDAAYKDKKSVKKEQPGIAPKKIQERPVSSSGEILKNYDAVLFGIVKDVNVKPSGEKSWILAKKNIQLLVGDEIRTGLGKARIKLRGRGEIRLPPHTHMILQTIDAKGDRVTIELKGGRIWNSITPGGGAVNYTVKTPDLVAGVRGTLFKVSINEKAGSRLAVFEGSVFANSVKDGPELTVESNLAVYVDEQGNLTQPEEVDPEEIKEWTEWDEWELEIHNKIASRFIIGGQQIDAMARLAAADGKKHEKIVSQTNRQILINRESERIDNFKNAFMKFAEDTGVFPSSDLGFAILIEDPGLPGWNGPYIEESTLPLKDRWCKKLTYILKESPASGNKYGELISNGADRRYQEGKPGSDDIKTIIPYYKIKF